MESDYPVHPDRKRRWDDLNKILDQKLNNGNLYDNINIDTESLGNDERFDIIKSHNEEIKVNSRNESKCDVHPTTKKRWDDLNKMFEGPIINNNYNLRGDSSSESSDDDDDKIVESIVDWKTVHKVFITDYKTAFLPTKGDNTYVSNEKFDVLYNYLSIVYEALPRLCDLDHKFRLQLIDPILLLVSSHFKDIKIFHNYNLKGKYINANINITRVLIRNNKGICLVLPEKDKIVQGKYISLIGCELLRDSKNLDIVYGVSTNLFEWLFIKNECDKIYEDLQAVEMENSKPTKEAIRYMANSLYSMLMK